MNVKLTRLLLAVLLGSLSGCSVQFPNVRVCAVAGGLQAGMDCAYSGSDNTEEMNMAESIRFLEAGALCMSSEDFKRQKNAIEELCYRAGDSCSFETKQAIEDVSARLTSLQVRTKRK